MCDMRHKIPQIGYLMAACRSRLTIDALCLHRREPRPKPEQTVTLGSTFIHEDPATIAMLSVAELRVGWRAEPYTQHPYALP